MKNVSDFLFNTLEKNGMTVSPWVEQAYPRALAQASMADEPLYIPFDKNNVSFMYTPGSGPACVLGNHFYQGGQGTVRKIITADKVLGFKTVGMVWGSNPRQFERELTALDKLGQLTWVERPEMGKNENVGVLMFPFHEGMTLLEYMYTSAHHQNDKIVLQLFKAFRDLHFKKNIYHNDLHKKNIMITETQGDVKVHIIDFGCAFFADDHGASPSFDIQHLTAHFTTLFAWWEICSPVAQQLKDKFIQEWGAVSTKYAAADVEDRNAYENDFIALEADLEAIIASQVAAMKNPDASCAPVRFSVAPAAGPAEDNRSLNRNVL